MQLTKLNQGICSKKPLAKLGEVTLSLCILLVYVVYNFAFGSGRKLISIRLNDYPVPREFPVW